MRGKFPEDKFDFTQRANSTIWWIKCFDCPGMVSFLAVCVSRFPYLIPRQFYKTGPDETLNNFEIHLKNRNHRKKVADRLGAVAVPAPAPAT